MRQIKGAPGACLSVHVRLPQGIIDLKVEQTRDTPKDAQQMVAAAPWGGGAIPWTWGGQRKPKVLGYSLLCL